MGNKTSKSKISQDVNYKNEKKIETNKCNSFFEEGISEIMRLNDIQHAMIELFSDDVKVLSKKGDKRFFVLDIGCGSCAWSYTMAKENEEMDIIGIDTNSEMEDKIVKPVNFTFKNINILSYKDVNGNEISYYEDKFDYIHMQLMTFSFYKDEWEVVINNVIKLLKKGGHLKIIEHDLVIYKDSEINIESYINSLEKLNIKNYNIFMKIVDDKNYDTQIPIKIKTILNNKKEIQNINYTIKKTNIGWGDNKFHTDIFKEACISSKKSVIEDYFKSYYCKDEDITFSDEYKNIIYKDIIEDIINQCRNEKGIWTWHGFLYIKK